MLERNIENAVSKYAKARGWFVTKYTGSPGCPDRLFIKNGIVVFIEFKAPNKKPRALQIAMHNKMRNAGAHVYVIDNIEKGKRLLNEISPPSIPGSDN